MASSLPNESRTASAGREAPRDEQHVEHEQRDQAEQADLLAEGRHDEVGGRQRHELGMAAAQPGAEDAAGAEPEQRLPQLVTVVVVGR